MRSVALALALALLGASCSSSVAGPSGTSAEYDWVRGQLSGVVKAPLPEAERATRLACADLGLVALVGTVDGRAGRVEARTAMGTKVRVALLRLDGERTLVSIRVGHIGDRAVSMQLLRHIADHVSATPPSTE